MYTKTKNKLTAFLIFGTTDSVEAIRICFMHFINLSKIIKCIKRIGIASTELC